MLARLLYVAVAIAVLGAFSRPARGGAADGRAGQGAARGAAPSQAAWTPRDVPRR